MAPDSTQWPLEPHTAAKHEILRRYLNAWFPILGSHHGRVVFLDGFAGPGIYSHGEPGSPIVALRTLFEHSYFHQLKCEFVFWFLESRRDWFEALGRSSNSSNSRAVDYRPTSRSGSSRRRSKLPQPPW